MYICFCVVRLFDLLVNRYRSISWGIINGIRMRTRLSLQEVKRDTYIHIYIYDFSETIEESRKERSESL